MKEQINKSTPEPTLEQVLGAELAQDIKDDVNSITEEELTDKYLCFLSTLQHMKYSYGDELCNGGKREEELTGLRNSIDEVQFAVQCIQERFPHLKGANRALQFCPGYGLMECIVSEDPTSKPICRTFFRFGTARGAPGY